MSTTPEGRRRLEETSMRMTRRIVECHDPTTSANGNPASSAAGASSEPAGLSDSSIAQDIQGTKRKNSDTSDDPCPKRVEVPNPGGQKRSVDGGVEDPSKKARATDPIASSTSLPGASGDRDVSMDLIDMMMVSSREHEDQRYPQGNV